MRPARPTPIPFTAEHTPAKLVDRDQFVCWRYKWMTDREEWTKIPIDASTGDFASSTDAETWATFEEALAYHDDADAETDGLGFVVSDGDMVVGIDLDDCRDPATGEIDAWAREVVDALPTYWEVSPSGTGLRGFGFGFLPGDKTRSDVEGTGGHIEVYEKGRYLTLTGEQLEAATDDVEVIKAGLSEVYHEYISEEEKTSDVEADPSGPNPTPDVMKNGSSGLSDAEIIEKAKASEKGDDFRALWNGNTAGYPSHSEADLALVNHLAFWTGGDRQQMDRLFRDSGLYREKWDADRGGQTYGEKTIKKALSGRSDFYSSNGSKAERKPTPATEGRDPGLNESGVKAWAGLGEEESISDLTDREKAAVVCDLIEARSDTHVRVRRDNRTLWAFDTGVWKQEGGRALQHTARKALGSMNYGRNVASELEAQAKARLHWEVEADAFGLEPGLIAVENGLLYLEAAANGSGDDALRDLKPEDYALARLPVEYDPEATYEEWDAYVREWAEEGMANALQEYVGYCLHTGAIPIDRALLLVGTGANGKSTFLHVVRALLGEENTTSIGLQTLANEQDAVADFYGSLANIDDDLSTRKLGQGLGMFKKLVAGDRVRGRRLYDDGFEYKATGKHLYAANQVPNVDVSDDDEAFWRRWLLVEFPNHYHPSERDSSIRDRFTRPEALSGVLNWAIDGWARLLEQGRFTGEEREAYEKRRRWQQWGDSVDEFISEHVERDPDADRITTGDAHTRYKAWCVANGKDAVGQSSFTNSLKKEDVGYKQSLRIPQSGGSPKRGYDALGFSEEVPTIEATDAAGDDGDDDDDPAQQSLV